MKNAEKEEIYTEINSMANKHGAVFIGSDFFESLPINELKNVFGIEGDVYNRSVKGAKVADGEKLLKEFVYDLSPDKVFFNFGESDISENGFDEDDFIAKYEWLLYSVHNKIKTNVYIVSVAACDMVSARVNERLKQLAKECGCTFIDIVPALSGEKPVLGVFDILKFYLRPRNFSFFDAMNIRTSRN